MESLWDDREAARYDGVLGQRVYSSRLLGQEPSLVLHGGGNTSVKIEQQNLFGEDETVLYVKSSGWDLAAITEAGFSPVRLQPLLRLAALPALTDSQMANELRQAMTTASSPPPSVEAILHALLPHRFVDHTHADAILAVTNSVGGEARVREIFGDTVVVVPYVMPGFALARLCHDLLPHALNDKTLGLILLHHGIVTFADSARESYERMIALVTCAEDYLKARAAWSLGAPQAAIPSKPLRADVAGLRQRLSQAAGSPMIVRTRRDAETLAFAQREDIAEISQRGPATPDHVLLTRRVPLVGRDIDGYQRAYELYFAENALRTARALTQLDPAPRVILDPQLGLLTAGRDARQALAAEQIYRHTMKILLQAEALGGYRALPAEDIFDVEYWELEQAKLRRDAKPRDFTGEVALVTGAASGIGRACVESFLDRGAAVLALDLNPAITDLLDRPDFLGLRCDVTDEGALEAALEAGVRRFGGLDMLVLNAGVFPKSTRIDGLTLDAWDRVMRVNLDANLALMRLAYPLLKLAPRGGRVVVVGSKNVPAPGPGQAAYSASKAALNQLARVAALEWGEEGIRVNVVHPNAVFDTGLWTEEVLQARARNYNMTVEQYKTNNVLKVEVSSRDVGELAATLCGPVFAKTTGAQVPIDGGNDRVI